MNRIPLVAVLIVVTLAATTAQAQVSQQNSFNVPGVQGYSSGTVSVTGPGVSQYETYQYPAQAAPSLGSQSLPVPGFIPGQGFVYDVPPGNNTFVDPRAVAFAQAQICYFDPCVGIGGGQCPWQAVPLNCGAPMCNRGPCQFVPPFGVPAAASTLQNPGQYQITPASAVSAQAFPPATAQGQPGVAPSVPFVQQPAQLPQGPYCRYPGTL